MKKVIYLRGWNFEDYHGFELIDYETLKSFPMYFSFTKSEDGNWRGNLWKDRHIVEFSRFPSLKEAVHYMYGKIRKMGYSVYIMMEYPY